MRLGGIQERWRERHVKKLQSRKTEKVNIWQRASKEKSIIICNHLLLFKLMHRLINTLFFYNSRKDTNEYLSFVLKMSACVTHLS